MTIAPSAYASTARTIALVGMMGAGKTTIGKQLAARLGIPFCDSDHKIAEIAKMPIAEIFARKGEKEFRRIERMALEQILAKSPQILATGGGMFISPQNRELLRRATTIWLDVDQETLWQRVRHNLQQRPLLDNDDPQQSLRDIAKERAKTYALADIRIDCNQCSKQEIIETIIRQAAAFGGAGTEHVKLALGGRSYRIEIGTGLLDRAGEQIAALGFRSGFIISDDRVAPLYLKRLEASLAAAGIRSCAHIVPAGEDSKSFARLEAALESFIGAGAERSDTIIALGGGVVGDIGGLVAGLLKRGAAVVQIPTSLLAQVDSSIGGKTAINSRHGKNMIGMFHQPALVLADQEVLASLPERHIRAGLAEMVKAAMISDADFAGELADNAQALRRADPQILAPAVRRACQIKANIVAADETEQGTRALLNLGHTFAHALEAANSYRLLHGEAVGCGLALALRWSEQQGFCPRGQVEQGVDILKQLGLATKIAELDSKACSTTELLDCMAHDKKTRHGVLTMVLLRRIGDAFLHKITDLNDLQRFLDKETSS